MHFYSYEPYLQIALNHFECLVDIFELLQNIEIGKTVNFVLLPLVRGLLCLQGATVKDVARQPVDLEQSPHGHGELIEGTVGIVHVCPLTRAIRCG